MAVPEAARRQAEEAEKALDEQIEAHQQSLSEAEARAPEEHSQAQPGQPGRSPKATPVPDEVQALKDELELERQRNASLKGRIDSQLGSARSENKELKKKLDELSSEVKAIKQESAQPGPKRHITEEEAEELGQEVLDVQNRIIKGTLEEELEEGGTIKTFVDKLVEQSLAARLAAQPAQPEVDEDVFWDAVERYYPGATEVNNSDRDWFDFLDGYDQRTGVSNRQLGAEAIATGDVAGLVDLLRAYKPPVAGPVVDESARPGPKVKPERTGAPPVVSTADEPSFTKEEVDRFYDDVIRGKFQGTKAEAQALEDKIMDAAQAGRITV